ncbi:hypothetical protein [Lichenicola sp.]|uniref:hypothetical protein n=1 Tax=Lichenicola sp. TaxID=2804529 RepID=UPI003AFF77E6
MPLTLPLPTWVPWWGQLAILVVAILFGLAFMMMPFAVFGLKGRLDFLEAQLDDIHAELRMLAMRLPDPDRRPARSAEPVPQVQEIVPEPVRPARPPAPPRQVEDATPPRRPRGTGDWSSRPPLIEDEEPRPVRTAAAAPGRDLRDLDDRFRTPKFVEPKPVERDRTEPKLRWPPPR